jgi:hypothetical protein
MSWKETKMSEDPRYRYGTQVQESGTVYIWELADKPVAAMWEVDGYVGYYDFEAEFCGSALSDATASMTYEEFTRVVLAPDQMEAPPVVRMQVSERHWLEPFTGLSVNDVQESALFWLLSTATDYIAIEDKKSLVNKMLEYV